MGADFTDFCDLGSVLGSDFADFNDLSTVLVMLSLISVIWH